MRNLLPLAAAVAGALGVGCGAPVPSSAPPAAGRPALVRIATWNVHDLFDEEDRAVPPGDADLVRSPAEVEAKLARIAGVLARIDADAIVLQEVENGALLERLAAAAGYPEARLVEGLDPRGIDVAALSRWPVLAYVSHLGDVGGDGGPLWSRDCVELHVDVGGQRVVIVASHLVSRLSDDGTRRAEQAARMRAIADGVSVRHPGARVVAGGDLNDAPGSLALAPLLGDGRWTSPAGRLAADARWTWSSADGRLREELDALLVPAEHASAVVRVEVVGGPDVAGASDHRPVVLDLWAG